LARNSISVCLFLYCCLCDCDLSLRLHLCHKYQIQTHSYKLKLTTLRIKLNRKLIYDDKMVLFAARLTMRAWSGAMLTVLQYVTSASARLFPYRKRKFTPPSQKFLFFWTSGYLVKLCIVED
jgi:hypothetical protein